MTLEEEVATLRAENAVLREQVTVLVARVRDLEARLAKDSHNSSKPPSSDGLARKTKSLRKRSGRKPGGQIGHPGETLRLVAAPDTVVEHRPARCFRCHTPLGEEAPVVLRERRQVQDLPPLRLVVTEHHALHLRCPSCQAVTSGTFPAAAPSRAQYGPRLRALAVHLVEQQLVPYGRVRELLAGLFGVALSLGTLVEWVRQAATTLEPVEAQIKAALARAPVLHSDETGVRQAGRVAWAHVASTARLTHYAIHPQRGHTATDAIGILPAYRGVSVHDGWKSYQANTQCRHALCNIHHLRELTFLEEEYAQTWAKELKGLLQEMKAATDQARAQGATRLAQPERDGFVARYETLLVSGLAASPPPSRSGPRRRGRIKQSPARNLLEQLWLGRDEVLAFLDDLAIPFDSNQAERDLRMLKVQQKVAGCFRTPSGAAAFARLRGYLSTLHKQGVALLAALKTLFTKPSSAVSRSLLPSPKRRRLDPPGAGEGASGRSGSGRHRPSRGPRAASIDVTQLIPCMRLPSVSLSESVRRPVRGSAGALPAASRRSRMSIDTSASRPVRCALTAFVALLALTSACATSSTRGHTGTGTGTATASGTPSALPSASPVTAYFSGGDRMYALDGGTGAVKWTSTTGHGVGAGGITDTVVLAGVVFFHGTAVDAKGSPVRALYALDAATGTTRWELRSTAPAGELNGLMIANPVAVVGGTVFLVAPGGQVPSGTYALDLASGKLLWGADGQGAEAVIVGDRAIYVTQLLGASSAQGPRDEILSALDPATGKQLWQLHGVSGALLSGGLLYGVSRAAPATLSALDAATGATRWTRPLAGQNLDLSLVGSTLFVADPAGVTALDPATGQLRWRYTAPGAAAWYMRIGGEGATLCLEYHDQNGTHLAGVDAATGAQRWTRVMAVPSGGVSYGSGYGDGACYVRTDQPNAGGSVLSRLDALTGNVRWTIDAGGQVVGTLDIFAGAIYAQTSVDRMTSTVRAFSVANGSTLWQVSPDTQGFLGQLAVG